LTWDQSTSIIRLIDRTNSTPTGITEGGMINGNFIGTDYLARLTREEGEGKSPTAVLMLYPPSSGLFVRTAPILIDKDAPTKYLLEVRIDQVGKPGKLQRYRLSTPTWTEDEKLGEVLMIPCESLAHEGLEESLVSINDELVNPNQRIQNCLTAWNGNNGASGVTFTFNATTDIDIPTSDALKFEYKPTSPKKLGDLLRDVLSRLKEAGPLGGVFKNFYITTEADPTTTRNIKIKIEEFGKSDSGVIIDPDNSFDSVPTGKALLSSNKKRRQISVVKFDAKSGSLPVEHAEFSSTFLHASIRTEWSTTKSYLKDDVVKFTHTSENPNVIRFFKAVNAVGPSASNPDVDNPNWLEDFTTIPPFSSDAFYTVGEIVTFLSGGAINYFKAINDNGPSGTTPNLSGDWSAVFLARPASTFTAFFSPSPWTSNLQASIQSLAAVTSPPAGYVGFVMDWNYARILNDIPDFTNRFRTVTGKSVKRESNAPPILRELFDGQTILVGTAPTGGFSGKAGKIATFVRNTFQGISAHWEFSDAPINGDTITDVSTGKIRKSDGTNWFDVWDVNVNSDKPTCFHIVKSARLVKDASEISGQATEYRFDWKDALLGGDDKNRSSRGAWFGELYPLPVLDATGFNIGSLYGGDGSAFPSNPYINHINLNQNRMGLVGWNHGKESISQGRLSSHAFKIRVGIYRSTDDTIKSFGHANISMIYARKDSNNRWMFKEFTIPVNTQWHSMKIRLPPFGPTDLYFSRIDDLAEINGYTIPFDFFIQEKDFSGIRYEFRRNDYWCVFMKETYNDVGMYTGNYRSVLDGLSESASQQIPGLLKFIDNLFHGNTNDLFDSASTGIDHVNIAVCQHHYEKEGYAIFPATKQNNPRFNLINLPQETDYLTALAKAESEFGSDNFFPNERHISITGNSSIRYGQLLTEVGSRVTGGTLKSVCAINKETIDNRGYNQELFQVRKFVV